MVKKGFFKYIGNTSLLTIVAVVALSGTYFVKSGFESNILGLRKVTNGLHICFTRIQQTYTSTLIGAVNSQYLGNKFHLNSEECFGEVINTLKSEVATDFSSISKKLNTLGKEVHWFHNKIEIKDGKFAKGSGFALDRRFNDLENIFATLTDRIDKTIESLNEKSSNSFSIMLALVAMAIFLILYSFVKELRNKKRAEEIYSLAKKELNGESLNTNKAISLFQKMSSIVRTADIDELDRNISSQENIKEDSVFDISTFRPPSKNIDEGPKEPIVFEMEDEASTQEVDVKSDVVDKSNVAILGPNDIVEDKIDTLWTEVQEESYTVAPDCKTTDELIEKAITENSGAFNLNTVIAESVRMLVSDFFKQGIEIDFQVDQDIEILGSNESVRQVIHNVLNAAISLNKDITKISIIATKEGAKTSVEIIDNSKNGFDVSFLDNQDNLAYPHLNDHIGLVLCKELAKDFEGSILFDNLYSVDREIIGTSRLIYLMNPKDKRRLSYVRKSTKAELLKSFNA